MSWSIVKNMLVRGRLKACTIKAKSYISGGKLIGAGGRGCVLTFGGLTDNAGDAGIPGNTVHSVLLQDGWRALTSEPTAETYYSKPMPYRGVLKTMVVYVRTTLNQGASVTVKAKKNGSDTGLNVTFIGGFTGIITDEIHEYEFEVGDSLDTYVNISGGYREYNLILFVSYEYVKRA
jgi:hypothetical protein